MVVGRGFSLVVSDAVRRTLVFPPVQRHELRGIGGEVRVEDLPSRQRHDNPLGILPRSIDASPEFQFVPPGFEHRIGILVLWPHTTSWCSGFS